MYAQESILDILFMMLYGATAMLTLVAAIMAMLSRTVLCKSLTTK